MTINWTRHDRQTWLDELKSRSVGSRRVTTVLKEHVPARLASALCAEAGIADIARVADLPKGNRDLLLDALVQYKLPVTGHQGCVASSVCISPRVAMHWTTHRTAATTRRLAIGNMCTCVMHM